METILSLREKRQAGLDQMQAITTAAKSMGRALAPEERTKINELMAADDALKAEIAAMEGDQRLAARIEGTRQELGQSAGRQSDEDSGTRLAAKPADQGGRESMGFRSLGEQLQAIAQAGMNRGEGNPPDPRLRFENLAQPSGAGEVTPSDGGYLVQRDFSSEIIKRAYDMGEVLSRVRTVPISANANGLKINAIDETSRATGSRWGGVQVYWQAEADTPTAKKPKFRQMELNLKKLIGLAYATDELLADASALETVFTEAFGEEITFTLEDGVFNGLGAGQLLGITKGAALIAVAKETGQATKTIVKQNIDKMWSRCWGRSRRNAIWWINQDCEPQLHDLGQVVGTAGMPVYMPPGGLSASPYATIKGRPVIAVEYAQTLGTQGDIMLCDLSQYLMIDKGGTQAASSMHVRFIYDEMTFRWIYRCDGQPIWNSALTPKNGSNTLSPYVALATR